MDNSVSKALIMVGGVLLAILVISVVNLTVNKMSDWSKAEDDEVETEQIEKFNKEYEAYDKKLMYGVDVISCLNKVKSNNDKISNKYGEDYDSSYEIKVSLTLKTSLSEELKIYHMSTSNKEMEYVNDGPIKTNSTELHYALKDFTTFKFLSNTKYVNNISKFNADSDFVAKKVDVDSIPTTMELTAELDGKGTDENNEDILRSLLECSTVLSETIKNTDSATKTSTTGWTKAIFYTALYSMKTKKFQCTGMNYSTNGRVCEISFEELN